MSRLIWSLNRWENTIKCFAFINRCDTLLPPVPLDVVDCSTSSQQDLLDDSFILEHSGLRSFGGIL